MGEGRTWVVKKTIHCNWEDFLFKWVRKLFKGCAPTSLSGCEDSHEESKNV